VTTSATVATVWWYVTNVTTVYPSVGDQVENDSVTVTTVENTTSLCETDSWIVTVTATDVDADESQTHEVTATVTTDGA